MDDPSSFRIYTQTDYQTSCCSLSKLVLDGWSVSSVNRANHYLILVDLFHSQQVPPTKHIFTLKTRQIFSVHTTLEKFENATISGHFEFVFEENSVRQITWLPDVIVFEKLCFSKCFPSTSKTQNRRFQISLVRKAFRGPSMDGP